MNGNYHFRPLLLSLLVLGLAVLGVRADTAPTIASLSPSQTIQEGYSVTLSVSVNGTAPFTYQWKRQGNVIAGATLNTLVLDPIRVEHAGNYTVDVANSAGNIVAGPIIIAVTAATAVSFTYQPSNQTLIVGDSLGIYPSFAGSSPLTFVWRKDGNVISGASGSSFYKSNVTAADAGIYKVTIANVLNSVESANITVTVNPIPLPTVGVLPDRTVETGAEIYIYTSVSSRGTTTYQWYKDGTAIAGATNSSYDKYNAIAADAGVYTLKVTNAAGTIMSNGATVMVKPPSAGTPPYVSSISSSTSVAVGIQFSIGVSAGGTAPISYQWMKDGVPIAGATNYSYGVSSAQLSDAGAYTVSLTNAAGSITSSAVSVTVTTAKAPVITYMPGDIRVNTGDTLYGITVSATGTGTLRYQWLKDGVAIAGATNSYYYIYSFKATDTGIYTVIVSNDQGAVTSSPCTVGILPVVAPRITLQPTSKTVGAGASLSLDIRASGTAPLSFQWYKDSAPIVGASYSSFGRNPMASSDAGAYTVVVSNAGGAVTSLAANVSVDLPTAPVIIDHPASASLLPGNSFYGLAVGYRSTSAATIQWYRNGSVIAGASNAGYYIYDAQPSIAGTYYAVVTNSAGSATTLSSTITVDSNVSRPAITYTSGGHAIAGGTNNVKISITTSGSGEEVQWFKDNVLVANATSKEYSFNNFTYNSAGSYTARISNGSGTFWSGPIVLSLLDGGIKPQIVAQPSGASVQVGGDASFSVSVAGESPFSYQWYRDGISLTGATGSSCYLSTTSSSGGAYTVTVSNRQGAVTSLPATLTLTDPVTSAPVIVRGPASQTATIGNSLSVYVGLLNTAGVTYQWYKDGTAVSGGTNASLYDYYSASTWMAGKYYVVVTNSAGSATSNEATVAVVASANGPIFSTQPVTQTKYYGNSVSFYAMATSAYTISYQWKKNGVAVSGATGTTLNLTNLQEADAGTYTVIATDVNGSASSQSATLTLLGGVAPVIMTSPAPVSQTVWEDASFSFTGSASGTPTPTLQWQRNGVNIPGATGGTYVVSSAQAGLEGTYRFIATNPLGTATSGDAKVTLAFRPPSIVTAPTNQTVGVGGSATFSVVAKGQPLLSYQWYREGVVIAGATNSSLVVPNVQAGQSARYTVVVKTDFGTASADALLIVGSSISVSFPLSQQVVIGGKATFSATVVCADPLKLQWAKNGVAIPGATTSVLTLNNVQLSDAGTYTLGISRLDDTVVYPLAGSTAIYAKLTIMSGSAPTITQQPVGFNGTVGGSGMLSVKAQETSGSLMFQWQKDGVPIPNEFYDTLSLRNLQLSDTGDYRAIAIGGYGSTASIAVKVLVLNAASTGSYFGTTSTGEAVALYVDAKGRGTLVTTISRTGQVVIARNITIAAGGSFLFGSATAADKVEGATTLADRYFNGVVTGTFSGTFVSGSITSLGINFFAAYDMHDGTRTGCYSLVPVATDSGETVMIVGPSGNATVVGVDNTGMRSAQGVVAADGSFEIGSSAFSYRGTVSTSAGTVSASYIPTSGTAVTYATPSTATSVERLIDVATRGYTGAGVNMLTAGFTITGSEAKDVLIRAVGPGLIAYNISTYIKNPRLRLFSGQTMLAENGDWWAGSAPADVAAAAKKVAAFDLQPGSLDAALIAHLSPGGYTVQVVSDSGETGVALVEVYDINAAVAGAPKLGNLSTRGYVGKDDSVLIAGIVVGGSQPKKVLIRAVGPGLADYLEGGLVDPKLQLYQGSTVIRENDNWSDSADSTSIADAAAKVGAFSFKPGSKDAALLLYLAPGGYTAMVSGVNGATGIALVEAYEVP